MPLYEPFLPARYAAPLLDALQSLPEPALQAALDAAGIARKALGSQQEKLTFAQLDVLLQQLAEYSGRTDLGFAMGCKIKLKDHLALGVALLQSHTADELLRTLTRFSRLVSPGFWVNYTRDSRQGVFIWRPAAYMSPHTLRAIEEIFAVSMHVEMRDLLGERLPPFDVYLSMQAPPHVARYAELQPTRYHFGCQAMPVVRFEFPAVLLDTPLSERRQVISADLRAELQAQQHRIARNQRWSEWVTVILREAEGCQPSREQLAELLHVSPATLTRHLSAEGCNLRELGSRIRQQRACALLADPQQSITQIAYRLGYGDVANFSHAFRAQCGLSPRGYRKTLAGEAAD